MTVDELLALAAKLPPNVRRMEFDDDGPSGVPHLGHVVIEQSPVQAPPVPYVGDVTRAADAKAAAAKPSDIDSLGRIPPTFEPDAT